jgi:hypothetical protein
MRVIHAPPASVHSIRRPLGDVLTRDRDSIDANVNTDAHAV